MLMPREGPKTPPEKISSIWKSRRNVFTNVDTDLYVNTVNEFVPNQCYLGV